MREPTRVGSSYTGVALATAFGYVALFFVSAWNGSIRQPSLLPWFTSEASGVAVELVAHGSRARPIVILQLVVVAYLYVIYVWALRHWAALAPSMRRVRSSALVVAAIALAICPLNSSDIFAYIQLGRIMAVYHSNPYVMTYAGIHDPYSPYAWSPAPMPYGPVALPPFYIAGLASTLHPFAGVYLLKLIWYLVHACTMYVMARLLEGRPDGARSLFLFGFNPLLLIEILANGHNDVLVVFGVAAALLAVSRQRFAMGIFLATLPMLVKLTAGVLLAAITAYSIRRRGLVMGVQAAVLLIVLGLALRVCCFGNFQQMTVLFGGMPASWNPNSLYHLRTLLTSRTSSTWVIVAVRTAAIALMAAFCGWRLTRVRTFEGIARETVYVMLPLFIAYVFWPWYVTWLVPLAAIAPTTPAALIVLAYTATSFVVYVIDFCCLKLPVWRMVAVVLAHSPAALALLGWRKARPIASPVQET